jgi:hypothetical protein
MLMVFALCLLDFSDPMPSPMALQIVASTQVSI